MPVTSWRNIPVAALKHLPLIAPQWGAHSALCGQPARARGSLPCPREQGHPGECFWVLLFEHGNYWKAIVYRGDGRQVARGDFSSPPDGWDLLAYLQLLTRKRLEEQAKATVIVAPAPPTSLARRSSPPRPLPPLELEQLPLKTAAARSARAMAREAERGAL